MKMAELVTERKRAGSPAAGCVSGADPSDVETFLDLLDRQMLIYARLGKLVVRQRELVASEDPAPLLALLAERQEVTRQLAELSARTEPYQSRWEGLRGEMSESEQVRARELLGQIRVFLRDILEADGEDTKRLEVRKRRVADALGGLAPHGAMLSAYGQGRATSGGALNRVDEGE